MKFQICIEFDTVTRPMAGDFHRALLTSDLVGLLVKASEDSRVPVTLGRISVQDLKQPRPETPAISEKK